MRRFFHLLTAMVAISFTTVPAQATGRVACVTELLLAVTVEQGVAVDDQGRSEYGCSFIPEAFIEKYLLSSTELVRRVFNPWCTEEVVEACVVELRRAIFDGEYIYYEVGLAETSDADAFDEVFATTVFGEEADVPVLEFKLPNGRDLPVLEVPKVSSDAVA